MVHGTVHIESQRCKGCGLCIAACPQGVLDLSGQLNAQGYHVAVLKRTPGARGDCTGCALCALVCPDTVFTVYRERPAERAQRPLSRSKEKTERAHA